MLCERCYGVGMVAYRPDGTNLPQGYQMPCEDCGGTGYEYCCGGNQPCQNIKEDENDPPVQSVQ